MLRCTSQQDLNQVKIVGKLIRGVGKLISRVLDKEFWGEKSLYESIKSFRYIYFGIKKEVTSNMRLPLKEFYSFTLVFLILLVALLLVSNLL
jgi:hypothetical protein